MGGSESMHHMGSESKEFDRVIDIHTRLLARKNDLESIIRAFEKQRDAGTLSLFDVTQLDNLNTLRNQLLLDVEANRDLLLLLVAKRQLS